MKYSHRVLASFLTEFVLLRMPHLKRFLSKPVLRSRLIVAALLAVIPLGIALRGRSEPRTVAITPPDADPWSPAQTVSAAFLAASLKQEDAPRPVIIYVGVHTLYAGGHIPGAVFHGPGSTEQGINALKKFAATISKDSDVVLYCGCCPLTKCPNIRPAFVELEKMGFQHVRVLILPTSFAADWAEKGYPVEKSTPAS